MKMAVLIIVVLIGFPYLAWASELKPLQPLPVFPENPMTPEKIDLGRKLFFDRRLSGDGTMSCATCHDPERGYGDGLPVSLSYPTTKNWRNAPTLINVGYNRVFFWDGRAGSLEEQALFPVMSAFEMNQNLDFLEEELKEVPEYVEAFQKVFGGEITREGVAMALAAFQRSIISRGSPLDMFLEGDRDALTPQQRRGLDVFTGKGGCVECHSGPNLTDNGFYNLGVPEQPEMTADPGVSATRRFTAKVAGYRAYKTLKDDPGRYLVTKDRKDWKAFRTPTLREIGLTGPYMHNGVFKSLDEVIEFLDRGGGDDPNKTDKLKPLNLSPEDKKALRAFLLEALSGEVTVVRPPEVP